MSIITVMAIIFALMLLGPVILSLIYYRGSSGEAMLVRQERTRDPRFFGKSFSAMVRNGLLSSEGDEIELSRKEHFLDADSREIEDERIEELIIARNKDFCVDKDAHEFLKEIYSEQNVSIQFPGNLFRAIYSGKSMILADRTQIIRWVDAEETLSIYDHCDLGISATAGDRLCIGWGCTFRRLYAQEIRIGQRPESTLMAEDGRDQRIYHTIVQKDKEFDISHITKEDIDEDGFVNYSLISRGDIVITEDLIVQGDVRSHGSVRLKENAVICGNLFAEKNIYLEQNSTVLGSVFSQDSIFLEQGVCVGQNGKISSVIAKKDIEFGGDNFVFGYVSCEKSGTVVEEPKEGIVAREPKGKSQDEEFYLSEKDKSA